MQGKHIVVLGAGESGLGACILAKQKGAYVFLSDKGSIAPEQLVKIDELGIEWEQGSHDIPRILEADLIIKSPGIPDTVPFIIEARGKGIPVISEIEFGGYFNKAKTICITGSNGKTTTTMLTYHILKKAGLNVGLAGNVGRSFAAQVATENFDWYVIELSSFQLDGMYEFKADVAILLNITPDHLDRYDYQMANYVNSKFRIANNL
ncbi:MAG: UDP-N-acetylmuramoyl-L-alanine--D-glutamate ligase, partial [Bacteroidetes bacterium]